MANQSSQCAPDTPKMRTLAISEHDYSSVDVFLPHGAFLPRTLDIFVEEIRGKEERGGTFSRLAAFAPFLTTTMSLSSSCVFHD